MPAVGITGHRPNFIRPAMVPRQWGSCIIFAASYFVPNMMLKSLPKRRLYSVGQFSSDHHRLRNDANRNLSRRDGLRNRLNPRLSVRVMSATVRRSSLARSTWKATKISALVGIRVRLRYSVDSLSAPDLPRSLQFHSQLVACRPHRPQACSLHPFVAEDEEDRRLAEESLELCRSHGVDTIGVIAAPPMLLTRLLASTGLAALIDWITAALQREPAMRSRSAPRRSTGYAALGITPPARRWRADLS